MEQEQKTKCTGLVIDEYTIQSAELAVLESTIKELESEICKLNDAMSTNSSRKNIVKTIGTFRNDSGIFDKRSDNNDWAREPEINNDAYMFFFKIIHEYLKINDNNIHNVEFINEIIHNVMKISDDAMDNYGRGKKITNYTVVETIRRFSNDINTILGYNCTDRQTQEQKLQKLNGASFINIVKNSSKSKITYGFTDEGIFCTSCPFDWLKFCELDKEDIKKRRETIDEIDKVNDEYKNQFDKLIKTRDSLQDKASNKKAIVDEENKKKKEQQKKYDEVRKKNLEDIKTASGKNGFKALFDKIKKS